MLATGAKDEHVARQLNVSVRTVCRHIVDLIVRLHVTGRIEADVRAVRLWWI